MIRFITVIGVCVALITGWYFVTKEPEPYYIDVERSYTHCFPVMKFKEDKEEFDIMYWEEKCEKRRYITPEEAK